MAKKYDGWAIQKPEWNYIDTYSFRRKRTDCINCFVQYMNWNWRQAKREGWRCIKVKLVPVGQQKP